VGDRVAIHIAPDGQGSSVSMQLDIAFGAPHLSGTRTENLAATATTVGGATAAVTPASYR
jgi:hypothetical protein